MQRGTRLTRGPAAPATVLGIALLIGVGWGLFAFRPGLPAQAMPWRQDALRWGVPGSIDDDASAAAQRDLSLTTSADGSLHAVWVDQRLAPGDALYYARLMPGASSWSTNLRIWHAAPEQAIGRTAIAVDGLGQVHVAWEQAADRDGDIYHAWLPEASRSWSEPHRVNDDAAGSAQAAPAIAADPYGTVHLLWEDYRRGGADLYFASRVSSGEWVPNIRFHHPPSGDQRLPALAMAKDGWLHAIWLDSREGSNEVYASVLPPGGRVWWPNARISLAGGVQAQAAPRLAAGSDGRIHALWIAEGGQGRLRMATLPGRDSFWSPDREIYRSRHGALLDASLAAGPGGRVLAGWRESREDAEGSRIYAALVPDASPIAASRVDGSRIVTHGTQPVTAIDAFSRLHVAWLGRRRDDQRALVHASTEIDPPDYARETLQGRLIYAPRRFNCEGDGYVLRDCEGGELAFVRTRGLDLVPFLGSQVELSGFRVEDGACKALVATAVNLVTDPCPSDQAVVTGRLTQRGEPMASAQLWLGGKVALTGTDGRYYLDGLGSGPQVVTATMACGLVSELGEIGLRRGLNRLPPGVLHAGDIVRDCRVDLRDVTRVAGQLKSEPPFDPACADLDGDGRMSLADLAIVASRYGESCPASWQAAPAGELARSPLSQDRDRGVDDAPRQDVIASSTRASAVRPAGQPLIVLSAPSEPAAFSLSLELRAGAAAPLDLEPERAGTQAFGVPAQGAWLVLENRFAAGQLAFSAVRLGPAPGQAGGEIRIASGLASLVDVDPRSIALRAYDTDGRPLAAPGVSLRMDGAAPEQRCCWLPRLSVGAP